MKKVIFNLVFNHEKLLNTEGKALIQIEAIQNQQKRYFSTQVYIKPIQWDQQKRSVKNHPDMEILNRYFNNLISELEKKEVDKILKGESFDLDDLLTYNQISEISFTDFMRKEIRENHLKISTKKNHLSTWRVLSAFRSNILLNDLSYKLLCDFENFLLIHKYHRNTIAKHMRHIKRYINLAINKEMLDMDRNPFRKYKIHNVDTSRVHLTPEELNVLENLDLTNKKKLRKCLDMFLFSCYTGLRFSDITTIRNENFTYIDNKLWLIFSATKTDVDIRLPLYLLYKGKGVKIYKKYTNHPSFFNVSSNANSNINKQLKKITQIAGIQKKISFHTARHTNATLLLYSGAHITTVQKLLGHKSVKTTEIYSNIMDMTIIRDLEKLL